VRESNSKHWLGDLRVVDFSTEIAGPYCTKLLADAGADVIKVETPSGDPLRRWSASGADLRGEDGALFRFLNASKRSIIGQCYDAEVLDLIAGADLVVDSFDAGVIDRLDLPGRFPALTLLSITPFGRGGPWLNRPATEFTIQAESGSIGTRGLPDGVPFQAGGRITEWVGGTFAAVAALAAAHRARHTGHGEHVDFSLLEVMSLASTNFLDLFWSLFGRPDPPGPARTIETPSIEPTADGYVGFCTNSGQQFRDFLVLIERPDLLDDQELALVYGRTMRFKEWNEIVHAWTARHTTAEIVERASALRIPVAPVCNGDTVRQHEQLVARGVFVRDRTDTFTHPRPPYRINGESPPPPRPAPRLGEHTGRIEPRARNRIPPSNPKKLPLVGLRILDMTNWWAGPSATHMLATLGADVIHVESIQRPDGMRYSGGVFMGHECWWEHSPFFLAANTNKRGLTLNLNDVVGLDLFKRLLAKSDALVENFSPRVLENFGLDWATIHEVNPRAILVRMPAFGLTGPWRDNTGFAQTMEQMTGLAWLTGHAGDQPRIQRGPCDPLAGMHAAFAFLLALAERERTGQGQHVEVTMVEGALNAAAEQVIEFTAYGKLLERDGNRSPGAAPQGLYACRGNERWLALSVTNDEQWRALQTALGHPAWAEEPALARHPGRRAAHDRIDEELRRWAAERELREAIELLTAAGVPAAAVVDPRMTSRHPQMTARGFFEESTHPIAGRHPIPTVPFRYASVDRWLRSPAPTLGEHNQEILRDILGLDDDIMAKLADREVIGNRPKGA
jgi:crotonobetainyl-CoA:carnitine CoA-transferase CaiB-like acyl-CoA transferase